MSTGGGITLAGPNPTPQVITTSSMNTPPRQITSASPKIRKFRLLIDQMKEGEHSSSSSSSSIFEPPGLLSIQEPSSPRIYQKHCNYQERGIGFSDGEQLSNRLFPPPISDPDDGDLTYKKKEKNPPNMSNLEANNNMIGPPTLTADPKFCQSSILYKLESKSNTISSFFSDEHKLKGETFSQLFKGEDDDTGTFNVEGSNNSMFIHKVSRFQQKLNNALSDSWMIDGPHMPTLMTPILMSYFESSILFEEEIQKQKDAEIISRQRKLEIDDSEKGVVVGKKKRDKDKPKRRKAKNENDGEKKKKKKEVSPFSPQDFFTSFIISEVAKEIVDVDTTAVSSATALTVDSINDLTCGEIERLANSKKKRLY